MATDKTISQLSNEMTQPTDPTVTRLISNEGNADYYYLMDKLRNYMNGIISTKTASYTITDTDTENHYIGNNSVNAKLVFTLPTAADNTNRVITFTKGNANYGTVVIDGEGAETINGWSTIVLFRQYETVKIISDGTGWVIINDWKWLIKSGKVSRSTWNVVHLGFIELIGTVSGTFELWETVTDLTDSHRGIIINIDSGAIQVIWTDDGSGGVGGYFKNLTVATGAKSGATITLTADTKNVDSDVYHNLGINSFLFDVQIEVSTAGSEATILTIFGECWASQEGTNSEIAGTTRRGIDTDSFQLQTAVDGAKLYSNSSGVRQMLDNGDDYFYEIEIRNK